MKTIVAAIDFSSSTAAVCNEAARIARAFDASLWLVHVASDESTRFFYEASPFAGYAPEIGVLPGDVQLARNLAAEEFRREHRELHACANALRNHGTEVHAVLLKGRAAELVAEKAKELAADLIVIGSHGHGLLHKALLGSVSESILRRASCNVLVVPSPAEAN